MTFVFLEPAAVEFEQAFDWYQIRSEKAAEGFRSRVMVAVHEAMNRPSSAGFLVGQRVRKVMLKPYSYSLLYFTHGRILYVVAVAHSKRRPGYWQRRLTWV